LRKILEASLGTLIRHRERVHADPRATLPKSADPASPPLGPPAPPASAEIDQIILEAKAKHYADWADHPLPALGDITPRAAVRTRSGREAVELLLKDSENLEARMPAGQRFDFGRIRRELGLEG
jgi:hypothetical protein